MKKYLEYLTKNNTLCALLILYLATGIYVVATTDLSVTGLINLLDTQALAFGLAAGLASIKFKKAVPGETLIGYLALIVIGVAIIGAYKVFATHLTYEGYIVMMNPYVGALAIGKGLYANNAPS